jgi:hypothetical protein
MLYYVLIQNKSVIENERQNTIKQLKQFPFIVPKQIYSFTTPFPLDRNLKSLNSGIKWSL